MLGSCCLSTDDKQEGCVAAHLFSVGIDLKELGGQLPKYLKFCPGIEIQSHFRPKMSVCRHELGGGFNPPTPDNSNPALIPSHVTFAGTFGCYFR